MLNTGLEIISRQLPSSLKKKKIGVVCHAPSVTRDFRHITDILYENSDCTLGAVFGPQHGLFGETQDNMIEWEGYIHPKFNIPVFSLYGKHRKPTREMLKGLDCLLIDLQDVGTRPYTYVWTMKACMETAGENNLPVVVLDRPNPLSHLEWDGPVLKKEYFTFVGGASIPLAHRMTIGEIAIWLKDIEHVKCDLDVIWMEDYCRNKRFTDYLIPWVLPSPNMPSPATVAVYPGMVMNEATNLSEGRGTTIPFELVGAPYLKIDEVLALLSEMEIPGSIFRRHDFIPAFNKYVGQHCMGMQVHVTDFNVFRPVYTTYSIYYAIIKTTGNLFKFNNPPYEYEEELMPFDILSGDSVMRESLINGVEPYIELERWESEKADFLDIFNRTAIYREK